MERAKEKSACLVVSAAPRAKALGEKEQPGTHLTLTVQDVNAARSEIEKALAELGGRIIKTESLERKELLTVELSSGQREALLDKLKVLGEVKGGKGETEVNEGGTELIGIEIMRIQ